MAQALQAIDDAASAKEAQWLEEEEANPLLSMFLAKLPVIPFNNNTRVISTALDCIGGFSDWQTMHPRLLPHITPIVTSALSRSASSPAPILFPLL